MTGSPSTWHQHLQIGLFALGERSWVSHRAAAKLLGLDRTQGDETVDLVSRLAEFRGRGRYGSPLLDRLLIDSGGHTMLERRFLELVRNAGLPRPLTQLVHKRDGTTVARVDFLFEKYDVVIETDGQRGHASPSERAKNAQRRGELQDLGKRVYEYTWEDVTARPAYVERALIERLRAAGWRR